MFRSLLASTLASTLCLTAMLGTQPVAAQGIASLPSIMKPEYFSRDLLLFIEGLNLSEEQQLISEMVFRDYERQFNAGIAQMEDQVTIVAENVQGLGDDKDAIVKAVLQPIQDWAVQRELLGQQLVENVRVILDKDQQRQWTAFYRRLQREKHLTDAVLSGEGTNLDHILRDLNLQPEPGTPMADAKLQWEIALDRALMERFQITADTGGLFSQIQAQDTDFGKDITKRQKLLVARVEVRDVNDAAIEQFAALLGSAGQTFRTEALKRGYGRVYRKTPAQRIFETAIETPQVQDNPTLLAAVNDLFAQYLAALESLNLEILTTTRDWEPHREEARIENRQRRLNGEDLLRPTDPTREQYQQRRELGTEYVKLLQDLLGPDIFNELDGAARFIPRRPTQPGAGPAAGPGGGIRSSGSPANPSRPGQGEKNRSGTTSRGQSGLGGQGQSPSNKDD